MRKRLVLTFLLAGGGMVCTNAFAQSPGNSGDTTKVYPLPEVVTTASRIELLRQAAPSAISLITREEIRIGVGTLLSDHLATVPGLLVRAYGGGSALQTVSLRGMSPENTLVLVDGQKINDPQNGQADFGFLSAANIERIEIARGGYSSLYGTDAVGGVISITTRRPAEGIGGSISQTLGSFGYQASEASFQGRDGSLGWRADIRSERGRGNYRFFFENGRDAFELNRNGNDFQMLTLSGSAQVGLGEGRRMFLSAALTDGDRGVASPVSDPSVVSRARLGDRVVRTIVGGEVDALKDINVRLSGSLYADDQHYIDPHLLLNGTYLRSDGKTRSVSVLPEIRYTGVNGLPIVVGGEVGRTWFNSSDLHAGTRDQRCLYVSSTATIGTGLEAPFEVSIFPSIRYDHFSDAGGNLAPRLGVNVGLLKDPAMRVRSSIGKSFRVPTLNDLYWIAGGNPALKPERSLSFDAGIIAEFTWGGKWAIDVDYFSIATKDRILWTPTSGTYWTPKNISEVFSRGVELEARWEVWGMLELAFASTWTVATKTSEDFPGDPTKDKQLVYVPRQSVSATAGFHRGGLHVFIRNGWTSYRYTTEINDRFLPSFNVTAAAARLDLTMASIQAFVKIEATNLFGTKYQVLALYPMPLQEVRVTIGGQL